MSLEDTVSRRRRSKVIHSKLCWFRRTPFALTIAGDGLAGHTDHTDVPVGRPGEV